MMSLTQSASPAIMATSLPETVVTRFQTLQNTTVQPMALNLVNRFFYAYRKVTGKIRTYSSSMVGYFRGAAPVVAASEPLILSRRQRIQTLSGGYLENTTGNHMSHSSLIHAKSALFCAYSHRLCIAQGMHSTLALRFKRRFPDIVLKFQGWEVAA